MGSREWPLSVCLSVLLPLLVFIHSCCIVADCLCNISTVDVGSSDVSYLCVYVCVDASHRLNTSVQEPSMSAVSVLRV